LKSSSQGIRVWKSSEVVQSLKTLEKSTDSQTWSTVDLIRDLMDRIDLKELIHACISLIYHVQPHHGRKSSQIRNFPEIESGPVISTAKNGNFLILNLHHDTSFK
jgi:hypothetical protein